MHANSPDRTVHVVFPGDAVPLHTELLDAILTQGLICASTRPRSPAYTPYVMHGDIRPVKADLKLWLPLQVDSQDLPARPAPCYAHLNLRFWMTIG